MKTVMMIRDQIGGRAFAMLGAREFVGDEAERTLYFRIGRNDRRVNKVSVTLCPSDLYEVKFYRQRGLECTLVSEAVGVHVESLHSVIESHTGMTTSLPRVTMETRFDLYSSDLKIGHPVLGYIERQRGEALDDEERRLERFYAKRGVRARIANGSIYVSRGLAG